MTKNIEAPPTWAARSSANADSGLPWPSPALSGPEPIDVDDELFRQRTARPAQ
ncbi:hypothetical protein [Actinomadura sp. 6N118]|uniref:hypothetical protein n=1 Tax=Actinomadura sp. 6N118 TaxID=3375151 RepID=UPI00378B72A9